MMPVTEPLYLWINVGKRWEWDSTWLSLA